MFASPYRSDRGGLRKWLGDSYRPPAEFKHGEDALVAELPKVPEDGDGQAVRIYEVRLPATFYRVEALEGENSVGEHRPGFVLETGAGMGELAAKLALAIREGMLRLERKEVE